MSGPIEEGAAQELLDILEYYADQSFREINVTLDSPGGIVDEGLRIGGILAERSEIVTSQVGTLEEPYAECASACVYIFLGADLRYLDQAGRIGVHQFYDPTGEISGADALDGAQRLSSRIVALMNQQRVDIAFFERMTKTRRGIDWVQLEQLELWRVVTGSVFDERMERKNINGKAGLHMIHESLFGTNQMTLFCDNGMVAYAVLDEPEAATIGSVSFVLDGNSHRIDDFEIMNRDNSRTRLIFRIPPQLMPSMRSARAIGARIVFPNGEIFWGFEQTIRDARVQEMVDGCQSLAGSSAGTRSMAEFSGIDFYGGDLTASGIRDISFEQCKEICITNTSCRAVTYIIDKRWCWPKGTAFGRKPGVGLISAEKR